MKEHIKSRVLTRKTSLGPEDDAKIGRQYDILAVFFLTPLRQMVSQPMSFVTRKA
jgi:hypothetical protein